MKLRPVYALLPVAIVLGYLFGPFVREPVAPPKPADGEAETPAIVYWTKPGLEPDTCVAAWLLTRFVSPHARVVVADEFPDGVPFDIPGCDLQRRPGASTSQVVLERYEIRDPVAREVVAITQELEMSPWSMNDGDFFLQVRSGLGDAVNAPGSDAARLRQALQFLDTLRQHHLKSEPTPSGDRRKSGGA